MAGPFLFNIHRRSDVGDVVAAQGMALESQRYLTDRLSKIGERLSATIALKTAEKDAAQLAPILQMRYMDAFEDIAAGNVAQGYGKIAGISAEVASNPFLNRMSQDMARMGMEIARQQEAMNRAELAAGTSRGIYLGNARLKEADLAQQELDLYEQQVAAIRSGGTKEEQDALIASLPKPNYTQQEIDEMRRSGESAIMGEFEPNFNEQSDVIPLEFELPTGGYDETIDSPVAPETIVPSQGVKSQKTQSQTAADVGNATEVIHTKDGEFSLFAFNNKQELEGDIPSLFGSVSGIGVAFPKKQYNTKDMRWEVPKERMEDYKKAIEFAQEKRQVMAESQAIMGTNKPAVDAIIANGGIAKHEVSFNKDLNSLVLMQDGKTAMARQGPYGEYAPVLVDENFEKAFVKAKAILNMAESGEIPVPGAIFIKEDVRRDGKPFDDTYGQVPPLLPAEMIDELAMQVFDPPAPPFVRNLQNPTEQEKRAIQRYEQVLADAKEVVRQAAWDAQDKLLKNDKFKAKVDAQDQKYVTDEIRKEIIRILENSKLKEEKTKGDTFVEKIESKAKEANKGIIGKTLDWIGERIEEAIEANKMIRVYGREMELFKKTMYETGLVQDALEKGAITIYEYDKYIEQKKKEYESKLKEISPDSPQITWDAVEDYLKRNRELKKRRK